MSENTASTPTQEITAAALKSSVFQVTDAKGRKLHCRDLGTLGSYRLMKSLGSHSQNAGAVRFAQVAHTVQAIDDFQLSAPQNDRDIEAVLSKLGDEGFLAVMVELDRRFEEAIASVTAGSQSVEAAKN